MKTGILLLNLGTPDAPTAKAVRPYLKVFLSDPRVIDLPKFIRLILLYVFILPFRPKKSAKAYAKIWQEGGSPLLIYGEALKAKLANKLGEQACVTLGMRYGEPSIDKALEVMKAAHCDKIILLPLFPQYASASTGSALEYAASKIIKEWNLPTLHMIADYYDHPDYIACLSEHIEHSLQDFEYDHLLLSYHGVPERHVQKSETGPVACDRLSPCPKIGSNNRFCYRAQCYETTRALIEKMNLPAKKISTSFQSRLGKTPWIQPYTDEYLQALYDQGVRKLAIACPAFTADCLETLEEIGIEAQQQWLDLGGTTFKLVPCLNANDRFVDCLEALIMSK